MSSERIREQLRALRPPADWAAAVDPLVIQQRGRHRRRVRGAALGVAVVAIAVGSTLAAVGQSTTRSQTVLAGVSERTFDGMTPLACGQWPLTKLSASPGTRRRTPRRRGSCALRSGSRPAA